MTTEPLDLAELAGRLPWPTAAGTRILLTVAERDAIVGALRALAKEVDASNELAYRHRCSDPRDCALGGPPARDITSRHGIVDTEDR